MLSQADSSQYCSTCSSTQHLQLSRVPSYAIEPVTFLVCPIQRVCRVTECAYWRDNCNCLNSGCNSFHNSSLKQWQGFFPRLAILRTDSGRKSSTPIAPANDVGTLSKNKRQVALINSPDLSIRIGLVEC